MKTKLLRHTLLTFVSLTSLTYFSFEINRLLPLRVQWLYPATIAVLFCGLVCLLSRAFYRFANKAIFKTYLVAGPLAFITALAFVGIVDLLSSMKRTTEVAIFLTKNEQKLKQVVENNNHAETTTQILTDLNVRLIRGENDSYHFELYQFLGYGYRILYTEDSKMKEPQSPGKSPTFRWHPIKQDWYYYSYLD